MYIVVSYDISDDRRRTKVHKALKDFGEHVQYSVFECDLETKQYEKLRARLSKLIKREEDNVRFYHLCQACVGNVDVIGSAGLARTQEYYIV